MAAPDGRTSKTACPHGLFGSCKSLFTAAPHALPHGDEGTGPATLGAIVTVVVIGKG